eukprot:gene21123-27373_t
MASLLSTENALLTNYRTRELLDWAMTHSIIMALPPADANRMSISHAPFTLSPYPFPADRFRKACDLAELFNSLVDIISSDSDWLLRTLRLTAENDYFTGKLVEIFKQVNEEGIKQQLRLGINRSDYMQHSVAGDSRTLLQVEINTIASSFASLSTRIYEMYRDLDSQSVGNLPVNEALQNIAEVLAVAHNEFSNQRKSWAVEDKRTVIMLMVVQSCERNFADQRLLEFELLQKHGVKMIRASLMDIHLKGSLDSSTYELIYQGCIVSVVYYRAGYSPDDYSGNDEWSARLLVERSRAVKCPTVAYQLVGTKKVQQALSVPTDLSRFLERANLTHASEQFREVFAGLYPLDGVGEKAEEELLSLKTHAISHPDLYVLKPQREGGGNNFYGVQLATALQEMSPAELSAYILMERIQPPQQQAELFRQATVMQRSTLCELGIYGVYLCGATASSAPLVNKYGGYLLRVKPAESDEGGVAAGYAVLSCPLLI